MRSRYADKFNHDEDAPDYDEDVLDESDPIRAGYGDLLDWIAESARVEPAHRLLELGSGTGNLTAKLLPCREITCVDISSEMTRLAREKMAPALGGETSLEFVESDLLSFFDQQRGPYDRVVSSYTIHHLTEEEKALLFELIRRCLGSSGRAVFGDLMFENQSERERLVAAWRSEGEDELVETIEDELFWDLERAERELRALGFRVERRRFSTLSWGVCCVV